MSTPVCFLPHGFCKEDGLDGEMTKRRVHILDFYFCFDREVTGHAQYTFPQTLLWSALGPTGNQKVLLHHLRGLGWAIHGIFQARGGVPLPSLQHIPRYTQVHTPPSVTLIVRVEFFKKLFEETRMMVSESL